MPIMRSFFLLFLLSIKKEKSTLYKSLKKYPYKKEHYVEKKRLTNRSN